MKYILTYYTKSDILITPRVHEIDANTDDEAIEQAQAKIGRWVFGWEVSDVKLVRLVQKVIWQ